MELDLEGQLAERAYPILASLVVPRPIALVTTLSPDGKINVPLFTGFANTYQVRSAQEQVAVQEANRDKLNQAVALDVWSAYHNLNTARETFRSSADLLASAIQSAR